MTNAASAVRPVAGIARPLAARVVRPDWVARAVSPMVDAPALRERQPRLPVPAAAYAEAPTAFYVYRMGADGDGHVGVIADVRLDAFRSGDVRGHESVDPDRVAALVRYYSGHPARSEPVALLHDHPPAVTRLVEPVCRGEPLLRFDGADGLPHSVWRVTGEEATTELAGALGRGVHYVADGHHRVAARLRAWEATGRPQGAGVLCVLFAMDGLALSSFHRRVAGPVDATTLLGAAAAHFEVRAVTTAREARGIGMYVAGTWYDLEPTGPRPDGAAGLDASLLQTLLLGPALGVAPGHSRLESLPDHVPAESSTARCDDDDGALFVLQPPSLASLTRVADLGEVMPPKTTYFAPKPYAGIFLT